MAFVATAIIGSAVVGAYASSRAASQSRDAIREGTDQSVAEQRRQYDQTREDYAPWREMGEGAIGRMNNAMAGDNSDFYKSAGYEFVRDEGMRDTENRFSVGGGGGNAMRALTEFNSGLASTEYGNWFGRNLQMSGQGQNAVSGTASAGMNAANNISNAYQNQGANLANNAWRGAEGINNALQGGISNYLYGRQTGMFGGQPEEIGTGGIYGPMGGSGGRGGRGYAGRYGVN